VQPEWIFGIHDPGGEEEIEAKGKRAWIVFTEEIGHNPDDQSGKDYRSWSNRGHGVIVRLNNGYGGAGTIPFEVEYNDFAVRVANFIQNSHGADIWIIGNETNLPREWPGNSGGDPNSGEAITVARYVSCYSTVWNELQRRGLSNEKLVPAPSGTWGPPYDGTLAYLPNRGVPGFLDYWVQVLRALGPTKVGGLALHTYTHGSSPALVFSDQKMNWPYQDIYYHFRAYKNYMNAIPASMRDKPVWITETDQSREIAGHNWDPDTRNWVQNAFAEINDWNADATHQKIRALVLFRWFDAWEGERNYCIPCVNNVVEDFRQALNHDYKWADVSPPPGCPTTDSPAPDDGWKLEVWNNRTFSGEAVERRRDAVGSSGFLFDWGGGGPSTCTGNDDFAVRFSRRAYFSSAGDYEFTTTTDDGVRLWVDGIPIIDRWVDQAPTSESATQYLTAGWHDLRMDYYEHGGGAYAALLWERQGPVGNHADIRRDASTVPASIGPGGTAELRILVANTGGTTWSAGQAYRLGSLGTNQLTWEGFPCGGYSPSPGDSRVYLCHDVPPNGTYEFRFRVRAPLNASGSLRLALRMVRDGVEWFGDSETWDMPISIPGCSRTDFPAPDDAWKLEIWDNRTFSGEAMERRRDAVGSGGFSFDWGGSGPSGCAGTDNFAVRFSRRAYFPSSGEYEFTTTTDDGVRLWVDGMQVIDLWIDQAPTSRSAIQYLASGWHDLRMDYYEHGGGAMAQLSWENLSRCIASIASDRWKGEYFDNRDLSGTPEMVRDDGSGDLEFNWGAGSPGDSCGIPFDDFSVRWTRTVNFSAATYRFTMTSDDGFRLYVDDLLKLAKWFDQAPTTYTVDVPLSAGHHTLRLEYYERGGGAFAALSWEGQGASGLPDVVVESLSTQPSHPRPGDQVVFSALVRNLGDSPTPSDRVIGISYSVVDDGTELHRTWGSVSGPLAPGATVTIGTSSASTAGPWTARAGEFVLYAKVDDVDRFEESDESNNVSSTTTVVRDGSQDLVHSKIGFHVGPGGNQNGLGDWMRTLDDEGIPFFLKSVDSAGQIYEAARLREVSGVPHVLVYRKSGPTSDVPNYDLAPYQAAQEHWRHHRSAFPPELEPYKHMIWLETINEVDKNRAEWLGEFAYHTALLAMNEGFNWAAFGWSSGEPEPEDWEGPQMINFLSLAADYPDRVAVALHEYSFTTDSLDEGHPYMLGRFQRLFDVADRHGLARPTILITEFGWSYDDVPNPDIAMGHLRWADELYEVHPEIKGAAIWYLGPGFGGISDKAQKLISPVTDYALQKAGIN
jgi:hypothetical protein